MEYKNTYIFCSINWSQADLREGPRGPQPPPPPPFFSLYFQNVLRFYFENRFIKCSLTLSSEMLTLLHFSSRNCCMLYVLFSFGDSAFPFWIFWIRPCWWSSKVIQIHIPNDYTSCTSMRLVKEIHRVQIDQLCTRKLLKTDFNFPSFHKSN